ncbi:hypothetical protein PSTT_06749 [Puccinia striiformis]|uniref:RPN1 N-terminal domain-containing protein n=1 Tax=Puccinia striiformis TaxID=27350 RepID=A0A2S4VJ84_9BASI|nr:hypothetical protein PSTT_06749 [Puccinia striiformis]
MMVGCLICKAPTPSYERLVTYCESKDPGEIYHDPTARWIIIIIIDRSEIRIIHQIQQHYQHHQQATSKKDINNSLGRRSITSDMLRYFTMSSLDWEDEQQQVLLTDPNEIVAVVAEITLNDMDTPDEALNAGQQSKSTTWAVLHESDRQLYEPTLETLRSLIRTLTSSMTSVPWGSRDDCEDDQAMREDGEAEKEATAAAAAVRSPPVKLPEDPKAEDKEAFSGSETTDGEATSTRSPAVPAVLPFQAEPSSVKVVSPIDRILLAEIISLRYDLLRQWSSRHFGLPTSKSQI